MNKQLSSSENLGATPPSTVWGRRVAIVTAVVFLASLVFPIGAGLSKNTLLLPKWWGPLDVILAFVLAMLTFVIFALAQGKVTVPAEDASYRAYRILIHGIFVMIVAFLLFGDRITWINGLPGLAWRAWLLFYALPQWFTVWGVMAAPSGPSNL